jgi:hypothetical protein
MTGHSACQMIPQRTQMSPNEVMGSPKDVMDSKKANEKGLEIQVAGAKKELVDRAPAKRDTAERTIGSSELSKTLYYPW